MLELVGWTGAILLAFCALPQVVHTWTTKKAKDLSWAFLFLWWLGEIFTCVYVLKQPLQPPLLANYMLNIILVTYLLFAKVKYEY